MSETTTVMVFKEDLQILDKKMVRGQRYRDLIHELVIEDEVRRDKELKNNG